MNGLIVVEDYSILDVLLYIVLKCVATVEDYEMGSEGGFIEIVSLLDYLVLKLHD